MIFKNEIIHGDALDVLPKIPDNTIQLVITSPPYADQRKNTYGGISPDKYVKWFLPFSRELKRVLKPDGTFILNIKEKVVDGQRHTYVLDLILALINQEWLWTEEFIWNKKNCFPGKWPNRFRDSWERLLQFNKNKKFKMNQEDVMVPIGDWKKSRMANLSEKDLTRDESKVKSGFGKNVSNWKDRDLVYPTNVLSLATECGNKNHSAAFPESLPNWFIRLFTDPEDIVLDPFIGSGTTAVAAKKINRFFVGIEQKADFVEKAICRINTINIDDPIDYAVCENIAADLKKTEKPILCPENTFSHKHTGESTNKNKFKLSKKINKELKISKNAKISKIKDTKSIGKGRSIVSKRDA